jgi:hypothetical protein
MLLESETLNAEDGSDEDEVLEGSLVESASYTVKKNIAWSKQTKTDSLFF